MANANPRDLDPKFKDDKIPKDADTQPDSETDKAKDKPEETDDDMRARLASTEIPKDPEEGFITYRERFIDSAGNAGEKVHGPMPRSEWAAYSAKNGL